MSDYRTCQPWKVVSVLSIGLSMAAASCPAGPVLAGPVFMFAFKIAHAQTINIWQ